LHGYATSGEGRVRKSQASLPFRLVLSLAGRSAGGMRLKINMMEGKAVYGFLVLIMAVGIVVSPLTVKEDKVAKIQ